jgi:hypothetical protein
MGNVKTQKRAAQRARAKARAVAEAPVQAQTHAQALVIADAVVQAITEAKEETKAKAQIKADREAQADSWRAVNATPITPEAKLSRLESIIGYKFNSPALGLEAIQGSQETMSIWYNGTALEVPKNPRLAIVGDALLDSLFGLEWYEGGTHLAIWSIVRKKFLSNDALGDRGKKLGVDRCLIMSSKTASSKMIATAMEAIVGAVFKDAGPDKGWARTRQLVERLGLMEK